MADVIIIHGAYGSPEENWIPWLRKELNRAGHDVHVPFFPTPVNQSLGNWLRVFDRCWKFVNEGAVFIGHSLGPAFILNVLERSDRPVRACFFVAGFLGKIGNPDFDGINETFMRGFDWGRIRMNCRQFFVYASDNDPYVPMGKVKELAEKLGSGLKTVKGAGHFNEKAGYTRFELLLEDVKEAARQTQ